MTAIPMKIRCLHDAVVPIAELKLNPKNPNIHAPKQITAFAKILAHQGHRRPVRISKQSGLVTVGHGQIEASLKNKWTHVPVNYQDYDTPADEYLDMVADNSLGQQSELDLETINKDFIDFGPDLDVDLLGIDGFEIEPADRDPREDDVPEPRKTNIRLGDMFALGEHRLLCGDSTNKVQIERLMGGEKADITFTSPPYNLGVSAKLSGNSKIGNRANAYESYNDDQSEKNWRWLVTTATQISLEHSRYAFWNIQPLAGNRMAIWKYAADFSDRFCDLIIWDKQHAPPQQAGRVVNSRFELIWIWTSDDNPTRAIRVAPEFRGTIDNVFVGHPQRNNEFSDIHGATFPVELPEWFLKNFCPQNGSCIDLFGGSGSTLIACEKTKRRAFVCEIDPIYVQTIIDRWEQLTGGKAKQIS